MSLFGAERIGCPEVLASIVFIIEDAIEQVEHPDDVRNHINLCPNCSRQLEHEQLTHTFLVDALRRACVEKAPESLYESIQSQLMGAGSATEVVTTFSMTEISNLHLCRYIHIAFTLIPGGLNLFPIKYYFPVILI